MPHLGSFPASPVQVSRVGPCPGKDSPDNTAIPGATRLMAAPQLTLTWKVSFPAAPAATDGIVQETFFVVEL